MGQILYPGEYFIEMEFDRPVDPGVLHRALTSMGFSVVVFDQSLPSIQVGALASSISASAKPSSSYATVRSSASPAVSASKPAASQVVQAMSTPSTVSVKPTVVPVQSRYAQPASNAVVSIADGGTPAALKSSASAAAIQKSFASQMASPSVSLNAKKPVIASMSKVDSITIGPMSTGPAKGPTAPVFPGDVPSPSADVVSSAPSPSASVPDKTPFVPSGGGGGGESQEASATPSPAPEQEPIQTPSEDASPSTMNPQAVTPSPAEILTDLWKRWKEWGSPFASGPQARVSGGDDDPLRFRLLARLDRPIALDDRPGMRWLFVKALSFPFLSDLNYQSFPHTLRQGSLYELRFLARAKSNRTRDSVRQGLTDMGFRPVKLLAFKNNMTLPRRPASLTLWYGMAVWDRADSVIVHDDPFFFETVKEIRPQ